MTIGMYSIIGGAFALLIGLIIGYLLNLFLTNKRISSARARAENLLTEAKNKAQDLLLEAKSNSLKILEEAKNEEQERHRQLVRIEEMLSKRESESGRQGKRFGERKANARGKGCRAQQFKNRTGSKKTKTKRGTTKNSRPEKR